MEDSFQSQQGGTLGGGDPSINLRQYWHVILERRWLIVATWSVCIILGVLYAFQATPMFRAVARLQIDPENQGVLNLNSLSLGNQDQNYLTTQYRNLESRSLILEVMDKLKLESEDERYSKAIDKVTAVTKDIKIVPIRLSRLVEVQVTHPKGEQAQRIADMILKVFLQRNLDDKKQKALQGFQILEQEAKGKEVELADLQKDLQKYRKEKGMVSLKDEQNIDAATMRDLKTAYETLRSTADIAKQTAQQAREWVAAGKEITDFGPLAKDEQVAFLRKQVNENSSKLAGLRTKYREKHPKVIQVYTQLQADSQRLRDESERAIQAIFQLGELESSREAEALRKYKESVERVFALDEAKIQYDIMEQKLKRVEGFYQTILTKAKDFDIGTKDLLQNMKVQDPAFAPLKPVSPNKPLIFVGSVVGGLAVALGLALFFNFLDDSVKSQEDVENFLRLPFLGYIPNIKSASIVERDLQSHLHPTSSPAEGFRTLRAAISLAKNADKLRVLAFTSTIPSEGKSLVASNFAIVTSQTGLKTLLVDADLRRPSVHKAFQLQSPVGLSAYLAGRTDNLSEFIHTTEVPNLDVICCGAVPPNPSELVGSNRMVRFLEEAARRYDRVVLDCPPVSAVSDPLIVGAMADAMVFVTKFNKIRREHAQRSVQRIQDAGIHLVGLVLNDIDFEGKDSYYYSYHYYQNRYYSSHYRNKSADEPAGKKTPSDTAKSA
ncbi:MAG: polysaccharide biosynthesis tyrosine autokinase [Verrucomicrobium sp.]|jgi:capsular exopolysaccharide synthesis family protein|nr:polysaccharide biosynthesis tyrosine autokinase [Verrucomicrobium sp.]